LKRAERVFRIGRGIDDMNRAKFQQNAPDQTSTSRFEAQLSLVILVSSRQPVGRVDLKKSFISWTSNSRQIGLTQSSSRLDECIEHHIQIEGRAADHLEHIGGSGLLLQRFAQLVEQPRVLYGNDRLIGEILHQLDLPVGEGPDFLTIDDNAPHQRIVLEHGYCEVRSRAPNRAEADGTPASSAVWTTFLVCHSWCKGVPGTA
jgi:hypothetical protein